MDMINQDEYFWKDNLYFDNVENGLIPPKMQNTALKLTENPSVLSDLKPL